MKFSYWENKTWLSNIDFVVVGSGIVGLNCALELRTKHPKSKIVILEKKLACAPCYGSRCRILTHACMKDIQPEEVMQEIELLMGET